MTLEQICVSLELSKKLKELGVDAPSYFKWESREGGYSEIFHSKATSCAHAYYPAYIASELGELLPIFARAYNQLSIEKGSVYKWAVKYECSREGECAIYDDKLSDALAKTLIYLLENGLIKAEDVNK